jgi:2-polyprenyl-6-methoxyphenol hydroxylase-like FAD-dependent oxidoreductase
VKQLDGGTAHVGYMCHKQPVLEKWLRKAMLEYPSVSLVVGAELVAVTEEVSSSVTVSYRHHDSTKTLRGRFLCGADGKTGFVRKLYLEPRGIHLELSNKWAILSQFLP